MNKYCRVDREGKLSIDGDPRLLFAVMLGMRVWIVCIVWRFTAYASMIAGRYAVTRRQFSTLMDRKKERKLMDYQAHQIKLMSALSTTITFNLA